MGIHSPHTLLKYLPQRIHGVKEDVYNEGTHLVVRSSATTCLTRSEKLHFPDSMV